MRKDGGTKLVHVSVEIPIAPITIDVSVEIPVAETTIVGSKKRCIQPS